MVGATDEYQRVIFNNKLKGEIALYLYMFILYSIFLYIKCRSWKTRGNPEYDFLLLKKG